MFALGARTPVSGHLTQKSVAFRHWVLQVLRYHLVPGYADTAQNLVRGTWEKKGVVTLAPAATESARAPLNTLFFQLGGDMESTVRKSCSRSTELSSHLVSS